MYFKCLRHFTNGPTTAVLIVATMLISGCSTLNVTKKPLKVPPIQAPIAQPLTLGDVKWGVLTRPELERLLSENSGDITLFTLDPTNFKTMELNLVEIKRYMTEQKAIILFYQKANEPTK